MANYKQTKYVVVDPDIEIGLNQLNTKLKTMQLDDLLIIDDIKPLGNTYFITYMETENGNTELIPESESVMGEDFTED